MPKNDVGSYLEISRTILAACLKNWSCTKKAIDFDQNDPFSEEIGACGALWRRLRRAHGAGGALH